ncbi:hypothetical protein [Neorhizobium petrolearium]|uniref:Uncharacterized protein n=1 Tax=Neorhizobium petrolearium TaxID=515361 RepID=A0ABY8M280_9HYPH|nr:hypothetical protein [Neorhizobium petrolearium]MCC2612636.1 hypothetical protein [Neorhizobium petrolearium]WGI67759.1 hypothetical protein QEO92_22680 [Neorhizobium petrolearium]
MSNNLRNRLARLESSIQQATPEVDWTTSPAYLALPEEDRQALQGYVDRFNSGGLQQFTDDELLDFERILVPLAKEEKSDAERL